MDDLEKNKRVPLLGYIKLCALFQIHQWIQTGVTVWKRSIQAKIGEFWSRVTLKFDKWPWWKTISHLSYATSSFVQHFIAMCEFKSGVTVWKRLNWVLTSLTLTFELWHWTFAWTSFLPMVVTPENLMMIRWWEHIDKGVTDRQTDGQRDGQKFS